jgi:hypothetical protein
MSKTEKIERSFTVYEVAPHELRNGDTFYIRKKNGIFERYTQVIERKFINTFLHGELVQETAKYYVPGVRGSMFTNRYGFKEYTDPGQPFVDINFYNSVMGQCDGSEPLKFERSRTVLVEIHNLKKNMLVLVNDKVQKVLQEPYHLQNNKQMVELEFENIELSYGHYFEVIIRP